MELLSINPYIRFAQPVTVYDINNTKYSYDCRLFYIKSGKCLLNVCNKTYQLSQGSLLIWQGGTPYKFLVKDNLKIISVNFDYTCKNTEKKDSFKPVPSNKFDPSKVVENLTFSDSEMLNTPLIIENGYQTENLIDLLCTEFAKKMYGFETLCSALLKEIIVKTVRTSFIDERQNHEKIDIAIRYIDDNFNSNISNTQLAEKAGYHPYHLNRLFKKATGMSIHQYILNVRIEKAKEYLLNTELSVADISVLCGFGSPYHLSNAFKKKVSLSPALYRNANRNTL